MISLRPSSRNELVTFDAMDRQDHANKFVDQIGLDIHKNYFDNPNITYLTIETGSEEQAGYFILVTETDNSSLEFRRILIDQSKRGVGQTAIAVMEKYCKTELSISRIWLDVYEDNLIGKHIYKKMAYKPFKAKMVEGRKLEFYEKTL